MFEETQTENPNLQAQMLATWSDLCIINC